jgi:hypothetical protein
MGRIATRRFEFQPGAGLLAQRRALRRRRTPHAPHQQCEAGPLDRQDRVGFLRLAARMPGSM